MNSCTASCCACFPEVSCASGTSAFSPTVGAPRSCRFVFICLVQRRRLSKTYRAAMTQVIFGDAQNVVDRCRSSRGLALSRSNLVLPLLWSLLPHEAILYNAKLLPASARPVFLRLAVLSNRVFALSRAIPSPEFCTYVTLFSLTAGCCAPVHSPGAAGHRTFPQLNLHKARVRRNRGRLPSNGFIESAPEHRARAHFLPQSAPPIKR